MLARTSIVIWLYDAALPASTGGEQARKPITSFFAKHPSIPNEPSPARAPAGVAGGRREEVVCVDLAEDSDATEDEQDPELAAAIALSLQER
jgi:hypothetical protein